MADDAATPTPEVSPAGESIDSDEEETVAAVDTETADDTSAAADDDTSEADTDDTGRAAPRIRSMSPLRIGLVAGLAAVLVLGGLSGWLGYRAYQSQQVEKEHELYLQVARQGAINLTTIDFQNADADIQRILDSATGQFHDDFAQRSQPFIDVVKQAQSKSVGTVTEAGLESATSDRADALVSVSVKTSNAGAPEQQPRLWRMRLSVEKRGDDVKVSNVGFVP